jgi:hypothetical protein
MVNLNYVYINIDNIKQNIVFKVKSRKYLLIQDKYKIAIFRKLRNITKTNRHYSTCIRRNNNNTKNSNYSSYLVLYRYYLYKHFYIVTII